MELTFENMLYSDIGLEKPYSTETDKSRSSYPGTGDLRTRGCDAEVHWIKEGTAKSFTLHTNIQDGDLVFVVIENKDSTYTLYIFQKNGSYLSPTLKKENNEIQLGKGNKFTITDQQKFCCQGDISTINDCIRLWSKGGTKR